MMANASKVQSLTADYEGPTGRKHMQHEIGLVPSDISTAERVKYLAVLRSAVVALQEETNILLTQKMEEDKTVGGNFDDKKEEENYGEEVVDDS